MTLTRHHDIDIYHTHLFKNPPVVVEGVIIVNENEHGHAGYLAAKGLTLSKDADFRINSKLMGNITFNQTVSFGHAGWDGWYIKTKGEKYWAVVNINEWPTTSLFPIEESKNTWIYAYPVVRDVLDYFKSVHHATQCLVLTTSAVHEALDPAEFRQMKENEFVGYNWSSANSPEVDLVWAKNDGGAFFTPPAWLFPYFAKNMGYAHAHTFMVGYNDEKEINDVAGDELMKEVGEHIKLTLYGRNRKALAGAVKEMEELNKKADEVRRQIEELAKGKPPTNNGMWG